jgi:MFS family permease
MKEEYGIALLAAAVVLLFDLIGMWFGEYMADRYPTGVRRIPLKYLRLLVRFVAIFVVALVGAILLSIGRE